MGVVSGVISARESEGAFFGRIQKRICDLRSYGFFTGESKRRNEFAEWHVEWLAE